IGTDDPPYVVFVTANEEHAVKAFEVGAVDYLLKPFTAERFDRVLQRARERVPADADLRQPKASSSNEFLHRLLVFVDGRAIFLPTDSIDRVVSDRNYVHVFAGKREHRVRATLAALQERLDPAQFLRINRSTVVRLDAVKEIHEWSHGDYRAV